MGREVNYRNPYGSNPSPAAKDIPVSFWHTQRMSVGWQALNVAGNAQASWSTPTFDLRPSLRSSQNDAKSGVPIWDSGARLYVQVFNLLGAAANTQFLRLEYREFANTTYGSVSSAAPNRAVAASGFPNQVGNNPVVRVTPSIDVTSELMLGTDQPDSIVLVFESLGEGYPIRYWQVQLLWTNIGALGPDISFQAAMY